MKNKCIICGGNLILQNKFFLNKVHPSWTKCTKCNFSNIDIKSFDDSIYTNKNLASKTAKKRHVFFKKMVSQNKFNNILEYGGGSCFISRDFSLETKTSVKTIDLFYRNELENYNVKQYLFNEIDLEDFFAKYIFDLIIIDNVLEHLKNPLDLIKIISKTQKNCTYIISVPNKYNFKNFINFNFTNEFNHIVEHINIFSDKSINQLFLGNGFRKEYYIKFPKSIFELFVLISINVKSIFGIYKIYKN